ncbi:MAG: hypothetical protein M9894_31350 [Planctomycetes bacterium]|nr:hypothetical protein [Planctomycetota bacterium]
MSWFERSRIVRSHERMVAVSPYLFGPLHAWLLVSLLLLVVAGGVVATWRPARDDRGAAALDADLDAAWRGAPAPSAATLRARFEAARPLGPAEVQLLALEGLEAVAAGDAATAQARVAALDGRRVGTGPYARALRGALLASTGDAHEAVDELTRAIDAGLAHPDLRGWRGVALVTAGLAAPERAREALVDLAAAAAARPLRPAEEAARAKALAAQPAERP